MQKGHELVDIRRTLHLTELLTTQEVDMHIDALLHRHNLRRQPPDVKEGFDVTPAKDGSEATRRGRQSRDRAAHLCPR